MIRSIKVGAVSLGVAWGAAGCGSFLTGEKLSSDPNQPSPATRDQLFVGVQANLFSSQETSVAMTVCMWMQQCAGVGGRFVDQYSHYVVDEFSWDGNWFNVYTGGGLIDLRKIEASARADGRSEEHTSELQSQSNLVCRLLLEKKKAYGAWPGPCRMPHPITGALR